MRKAIIIMTIAGIIICVLAIGQYVVKNVKISRDATSTTKTQDLFKKPEEARKIMESVAPLPQADFIKDGYLSFGQADEGTPTIKLLYEEPGRPVVIAYLTFNFQSKCDYGQGEGICNEKKFEDGQRVHLEGTKSGSDVTVLTLRVLAEE